MNKRVLYKKEMELLNIAKFFIEKKDITNYISQARDAIPDLFYENSFNLRSEFIELMPSKDLSQIRNLLDVLKTICCGGQDGFSCAGQIGSHKTEILSSQIEKLLNIMQEQLNLNSQYKVFYSWQSDLENKYNRNFIENNLQKAINGLNAESSIKLSIDKDTKDTPGSPDIIRSILNKIDSSMAFVCDVSLICNKGDKGIVNPNVMFELGYAISSLSDEQVIMVCNTAYGDLKQLPFDLGLKRQISYFYNESTTADEKEKMQQAFISSLKSAIKAIRDKTW